MPDMKVTVYHNEARYDRFTEFNPTTSILRKAAEFGLEGIPGTGGAVTKAILEDVYEQLNIGGDLRPATEYTKRYREAANRSLSVGDVVVLSNDDGSAAIAHVVADIGMTEVNVLDLAAAILRYSEADDDRLTSLPYVWTAQGFIDEAKTLAARKGMFDRA